MLLLPILSGSLLFGSALSIAVPGSASQSCSPGFIECGESHAIKRTTSPNACNADNCLRALRDARYSVSASAFCSTYIQSTVLSSTTATLTSTFTSTVTPVETDIIISTSTVIAALKRRQTASSPLPKYVSQYPASRVSSACSCFITPSPITTVTIGSSTTTGVSVTETFPTTTTSTTTITTTTAIPSPGCAIVGCNQGAIDRPGLFATPQQCHDACVNFPGCKGYQIGPVPDGRMNCNLEGLPALQAAAPNADGSISDYCSQFLIYDVACPVPATCLTCF